MTTTLSEQADEVELHALGLRDLIRRAVARDIKRSPEAIEAMRGRLVRTEAATATLRRLAAAEKPAGITGKDAA